MMICGSNDYGGDDEDDDDDDDGALLFWEMRELWQRHTSLFKHQR